MPTRYLKAGVRDSEAIDLLSPLAETLFYRLLVTVDDFGRFDARPSMIKAQCFPIKIAVTPDICERLLIELSAAGLVVAYCVDGKPCLQVQKWDNKPRASESKFPEMQSGCIQMYTSAKHLHADVPLTVTGTGTKTGTGYTSPASAKAEGEAEEEIQALRAMSAASATDTPAKPDKLPPTPHQAIIQAYHDALPELPQVRLLGEPRKKAIARLWKFALTSKKADGSPRATNADEALTWVQAYFARVRQNDFLMGNTPRTNGHASWQPDIDYLTTEKGMAQVIEKTQVSA